jgi:hypothetical protein
MKWPTALAVIRDVCAQLALPVPVAAAASADDLTAQQMVGLLTWSGRRLVKPTSTVRWSALAKTWTLVTTPGQTLYPLPPDWDSFIDLTGWSTASRLPMLGPATDPQWACLRARSLGSTTISVIYRVRGNQFELSTSFSAPQTLLIDYSSRSWVQDAVNPTLYHDDIQADADVILFDNELITAKLKLAWLGAKGFDTTAAQSEYNEIEEAAINADSDAPVLSFTGGGSPLISTANVPDSGYGM